MRLVRLLLLVPELLDPFRGRCECGTVCLLGPGTDVGYRYIMIRIMGSGGKDCTSCGTTQLSNSDASSAGCSEGDQVNSGGATAALRECSLWFGDSKGALLGS